MAIVDEISIMENLYSNKLSPDNALSKRFNNVEIGKILNEEAKTLADAIKNKYYEKGLRSITGGLIDDIKYQVINNEEIEIIIGAKYTSFLEYGTYSGRKREWTSRELTHKIKKKGSEPVGITARHFIRDAVRERYPVIVRRVASLNELLAGEN